MDTDPITPMDRPGIDVADTQAPRCIAEVTLGWLEGVLRKAGRNVALASFSVERLSGGLMGNTYRIKLVHSEGSETMLPSVIFKCTGDSPSSRLLGKKGFGIEGRPGFYGAEVRFYDQFRDSVSIRAPQSFSTWLSPDEDQFSLLLEDYPNGRPGDEFEGCTQLQATDCMVSLAGLHAPFWNDKVLQTTDWMRPLSENLIPRLQGNMDRALAR
ncbi:MAG: hypothetical protein ABJA20_01675, partial [Novosphingobium sp.]